MSDLTGEAIFNACRNDPQFAREFPSVCDGVWTKLCHSVLKVLADQLNELVTVESFYHARITILEHILQAGWIEQVAHTQEDLTDTERIERIRYSKLRMREDIAVHKVLAQELLDCIRTHKLTDAFFFGSPNGAGLTPEVYLRWKSDELTIGDLLLLQPITLFNNDLEDDDES